MSTKVLLIDAVKKHRQVVRNFLEQAQPDIELVELDPAANADIDWAEYYLLIIDDQLGDQDGIEWVKQHQDDDSFPPVIFLSSAIDPNSLTASIQIGKGMDLGAEGFLFKKNLKSDKLNNYVSSALEKSGAYSTLVIEDDMFDDPEIPEDSEENITLGEDDEIDGVSIESTFHQMSHAKALLHGYDDWPFDIKDMLAGKAKLDGYFIDKYLGRRDDVFSFAARREKDNQSFVVKIIDRSTTQGLEPPAALIKDLKTLSDLKHPNLVHRAGYKASKDYILIVEELLEGNKLSTRLKKTGATEVQAVDYMLQILSGLKVLHENKMIAGALSPDNLLFRDTKTLVQTHLNNNYYPKNDNNPKGLKFNYKEALYMSPEMIQDLHVDHRSDLYVAGTIFFHMLAGSPPYHGKTTQDVITEHIASPAPLLPRDNHPMQPVIQRLMMKTPSQRLQSAEEVFNIIRQTYDH
jgi:DNA-binding response OmpR family regulator